MEDEEEGFKGESKHSFSRKKKYEKTDEIKQMGSKLQGAGFDLRDQEIFREILNNIEALLVFNQVNELHYPHIIWKYN